MAGPAGGHHSRRCRERGRKLLQALVNQGELGVLREVTLYCPQFAGTGEAKESTRLGKIVGKRVPTRSYGEEIENR
jgi:hypothetical protein